MATSWNKKERENKKKEQRQKKAEKRLEKKENPAKNKSLEDMLAYLDENGNIVSTPPDAGRKKTEVKLEDIEIGVPKQKPMSPEELIRKGTITFFKQNKGFGFIEDHVTAQRVFVHQSAASFPLEEGLKVTYEIERGPKGFTAVNVTKHSG